MEDLKKELDVLGVEIKSHVEKAVNEVKEQATKEIAELRGELKATQDHADKLDVKLQKGSFGKPQVKSLVEVIEEHKSDIQASLKKKGADFEFEVKADTLRASVEGNPAALDLSEIGQLAHRKLTLYDLFPKVSVGPNSNGVVRYTDWDEATTALAAAAIAEGGAYAVSTAKWKTYTIDIKKVGVIIPMSEELVYDAPRFAGELVQFVNTDVAIKVDTDLYSADGTGNNIKGLAPSVDAYVPAAAGLQDASIYDLVVKVSESIVTTGGSKYNPNFVLMNKADINNYKLKKDANNNYVMPPFVTASGQIIDGHTVIECNVVAANTMILGDSRFAKIYEIPGILVETGYSQGDWETDMQSLKGRRRLAFLIRNADKGGFKKVTSISGALTTLATAA